MFIIIIFGLNVSENISACDKLYGKWQSSKELSMQYNERSKKLTDEQKQFLEQILGYMKLSFSKDKIYQMSSETIIVELDDKKINFSFEEEVYTYDVISCAPKKIKIKYYLNDQDIVVSNLNLINDDLYWIASPFLPASREYFVRMDLEEKSN